ncbi:ASCH domain-containing protein [Sporomusa sp.]|uniref:ASCH domain-containing protein n=1 Tax=Sporomusa sp. TaxID=2078658 RepID=UPI002BD6C5B4|nr:ASCH domain-containing protein [Sporomusa sp.]HWR42053.1 ASCH domain-containing protein [Sporomusa sp.]
MFALNFISPHNEKLLIARQKSATIRLGDIRDTYPENSIVWITFGSKYGPKRKLYKAIVDRALTKKFCDLTTKELTHQNPDITTVDELIRIFESVYEKQIHVDDTVTVIHFSEVTEE